MRRRREEAPYAPVRRAGPMSAAARASVSRRLSSLVRAAASSSESHSIGADGPSGRACFGLVGRQDEAEVSVVIRGLALVGRDRDDHEVLQVRGRPGPEVCEPRLLRGFPECHPDGVHLPWIAMTSDVEPSLLALVPAEQDLPGRRVNDQSRRRDVHRGRPAPRRTSGSDRPDAVELRGLERRPWLVSLKLPHQGIDRCVAHDLSLPHGPDSDRHRVRRRVPVPDVVRRRRGLHLALDGPVTDLGGEAARRRAPWSDRCGTDQYPPPPDHRFTLRERLRGYRAPIGLNPSLRHYQRAWLVTDVAAGVTVGALTIPSALGYAEVAGLPPVYGLYAAMVPMVVFALVGSSRHLVLGPDGAFAALIGATLAPLAAGSQERAVALAPVLALLVGGLFLVFGLARVGFLANFLSRPLLSGFMTGLAITILVGQLPRLLGISVDADATIPKLIETIQELGDTELWSLVLGGTTLVFALVIGRLQPRLPAAVLLLLIGAGLVAVFALEKHGVGVVGDIPTGLPPVEVPDGHLERHAPDVPRGARPCRARLRRRRAAVASLCRAGSLRR